MNDLRINNPALWCDALPYPKPADNKYTRGVAAILAGEYMTGAAALAARAAGRIGSGLVIVNCPDSAADVYRMTNQSAIIRAFRDTLAFKESLKEPRICALLAGPGLGSDPTNIERILATVRLGKPIVLDADALNLMARSRARFYQTFGQFFSQEERRNIVLTPHRGEFNRVFPEYADLPSAEAASKAAEQSGVSVMLKGHDTYIAAPEQSCCVNQAASPWLATAGSGDVLAGLCLGLLAQRVPGYHACCIASAIHAQAAKRFGPGLIAEDLIDQIPAVLAKLLPEKHSSYNR